MILTDAKNTANSIFRPISEPIDKAFTSGVEYARSLVKPISNVSSKDTNYGGGDTATKSTTTYDRYREKGELFTLSHEPETDRKSSFGTIIEKVISPFIVTNPSVTQSSGQKKNEGDILTTGSRTSGNVLSDVFKKNAITLAQDVIDIGYNAITKQVVSGRDEDKESSKTTDFSPVTRYGVEELYNPSGRLKTKGVNPTIEPNDVLSSNWLWLILLLLVVLYAYKKK